MERVEVKSDTVLVLYMSSSFWLLGVESLDFSFAEKEKTAFKVPIRVKVDQMIYFKLISNMIEKLMEYSRAMYLLAVTTKNTAD